MPFKTRTSGYEWRLNIEPGDIIDVCSPNSVCYNATVLAVRYVNEDDDEDFPRYDVKELHIGYRVYDPKGDKSDEKGNYFGWSLQSDAWLTATNPRIHK